MKFHITPLCKSDESTEQGGTRMFGDLPKAPQLSGVPGRRQTGRMAGKTSEALLRQFNYLSPTEITRPIILVGWGCDRKIP